jgi:hypothetical protein
MGCCSSTYSRPSLNPIPNSTLFIRPTNNKLECLYCYDKCNKEDLFLICNSKTCSCFICKECISHQLNNIKKGYEFPTKTLHCGTCDKPVQRNIWKYFSKKYYGKYYENLVNVFYTNIKETRLGFCNCGTFETVENNDGCCVVVNDKNNEKIFKCIKCKLYDGNIKQCPKCETYIFKDGGCMRIHCRCGYDMCWECLGDFDMKLYMCHKCNKPSALLQNAPNYYGNFIPEYEQVPRQVHVVHRQAHVEPRQPVLVVRRQAYVEPRQIHVEPHQTRVEPRHLYVEPPQTRVEPRHLYVEPFQARVEPRQADMQNFTLVELQIHQNYDPIPEKYGWTKCRRCNTGIKEKNMERHYFDRCPARNK